MAALFLDCPEPLAWHQWDCGLFPDDPDIIRVPAHSSGTVVARWAQFGPLYPWRIINHSDDDIAVFLRTPEEFENFRSKAADDPTVELCEVKSRDWTWLGEIGQCSDRHGKNPHDCTTACGVHPAYFTTYCPLDFEVSCGGLERCHPPGYVWIHSTFIINPC